MKYKLKQWYPSLPKDWIVGMIIGKNDGHPMFTPTNSKYNYCVISKTEVQSNDYWSPYLFTTEDGVDIYKCDSAYIVKFEDMQWQYLFCKTVYASTSSPTRKYFSTKEAAQKWIEEQNRPKFEKGEWLYYDSGLSETLFRFLKIENDKYKTTEGYQITASGTVYIHGEHSNMWSIEEDVSKATHSQIEEILSKVAIHKGFKEGVQYKSATQSTGIFTSGSNFKWGFGNTLYSADNESNVFPGCIYYKGVWAEIVKEEIPEYVELLEGWSTDNEFVGEIFDTKIDFQKQFSKFQHIIKSWNWEYVLKEWPKMFKPSTKEAYDAQFKTKELTITLDGDVVNTFHWGNNVRIVYK